MKSDYAEQVLTKLEADIKAEDRKPVKPLPIDRWIAASVLQKAIRRNDPVTAERAALTLWHQDKRTLWRRLMVIALEDVGAVSPDSIVQTLTAFNAPAWRARVGDLKVALYLTCLLCGSVKIRLADEMYSLADRAPEYQNLREVLAVAGSRYLIDYAIDRSRPLPEQCLALWFMAGTFAYPSDYLPERKGSLKAAAAAIWSLDAPDDLKEICVDVLNKSQWPLALWTPLLWTEVQKQPRPLLIMFDKFQPSPVVDGIPLVALDGFTRIGKACFTQLQKTVPDLKPFNAKQIALGMFYLEGSCVDRRLTSEKLEEYRQAAEIADAESVGMDAPHYLGLREILAGHAETLEAIRREHLRRYLQKTQDELAFEDHA